MAYIRLCLFAVLNLAARSLQAKDPINDFCKRWGHQTAQVDGKLYVDGGQVAWNPLSTNPLNYTSILARSRMRNVPDARDPRYMAPFQRP